jgi:hypothetical protein
MIFVELDNTHTKKHFEAYNEDGVYLGIMDKDTMLFYAESILPFCNSRITTLRYIFYQCLSIV